MEHAEASREARGHALETAGLADLFDTTTEETP